MVHYNTVLDITIIIITPELKTRLHKGIQVQQWNLMLPSETHVFQLHVCMNVHESFKMTLCHCTLLNF